MAISPIYQACTKGQGIRGQGWLSLGGLLDIETNTSFPLLTLSLVCSPTGKEVKRNQAILQNWARWTKYHRLYRPHNYH